MAINLMCENSKCKYYYEDNCQLNLEERRLEIDKNGRCISFEVGECEYYKLGNDQV